MLRKLIILTLKTARIKAKLLYCLKIDSNSSSLKAIIIFEKFSYFVSIITACQDILFFNFELPVIGFFKNLVPQLCRTDDLRTLLSKD